VIQLSHVSVAGKAATRPRPLGRVRRLRNIPARNSGFTGEDQPLISLVDEAGLQAGSTRSTCEVYRTCRLATMSPRDNTFNLSQGELWPA
jgi:hypothetical protein